MPPKRKRNYAAEYRRRQELAQSRGFANYYDYRTKDYGRATERAKGAKLRRLRGHASGGDLEQRLTRGDVDSIHIFYKQKKPKKFEVIVTDEDGDERTFYIQGNAVDRTAATIDRLGLTPRVIGSPKAKRAFTGND